MQVASKSQRILRWQGFFKKPEKNKLMKKPLLKLKFFFFLLLFDLLLVQFPALGRRGVTN